MSRDAQNSPPAPSQWQSQPAQSEPAGGAVKPSWFDQPAANQPASNTTTATTAATSAAGTHSFDPAMIGRTSIGLIAVIALIFACAWLLKRFGPNRNQQANLLNVVASRSLGNRERVVVLEIEDQWLVLGVTAHSVTRLHKLAVRPDLTPTAAATRPSFGQALAENIGDRFGRRGRS